ncbi:MAG: AraC-like DNA-binding protein [Parvicella sp.]|jgi:AraC-like DNA-binding protein
MELDFLTSLFNPNFIKFEEVIQQSIYSNVSVNELAKLCNMSLSSFKSKFAEIYKVSPMKYFLKIKLEKASELLKNKNNRISHIAIEVGFESLSTFNRSFRAQYGVTPSKFRLDEND